jgi:hypothetical protein
MVHLLQGMYDTLYRSRQLLARIFEQLQERTQYLNRLG